MKRLVVAVVVLSLWFTAAAAARSGPIQQPGLPRPNEIRIEGYVGQKPAGLIPEADWIVRCLGKEYAFHVVKLRVLVGDTSYTNIIEEARPYHVAFKLRGDDATLQRFAHAPNGSAVALTAYQRTGGRDLLVAQVEYLPAAAPAP